MIYKWKNDYHNLQYLDSIVYVSVKFGVSSLLLEFSFNNSVKMFVLIKKPCGLFATHKESSDI